MESPARITSDPTAATESQIALELHKVFGQECAGSRALRAWYHIRAQPTQSGAQRLFARDEREEQARQHRVPRDAGPAECRCRRLLALFHDDELNSFLGEMTGDTRCCDESLRKLEESANSADGHATVAARSRRLPRNGRRCSPSGFSWLRLPSADSTPLPGPHGSARPAPRGPQPSLSRVCLVFTTPAGCSTVRADVPPPPTAYSAAFVATCCCLTAEHQEQAPGHCFVGQPHSVGDNKDAPIKTKNQAEFTRRRAAGHCFLVPSRRRHGRTLPALPAPRRVDLSCSEYAAVERGGVAATGGGEWMWAGGGR